MKAATGIKGFVVCVLCALAVPAMAAPPAGKPAKTLLTTPYAMTVGDLIGIESNALLNAIKPVDIPMVITYSGQDKWIEVGLFGGRGSVDGAKEIVEEFVKSGVPVIASIAKYHGVDLTDEQVTIRYLNHLDNNKSVLRREKGQYIVE